MPIPSNITGTPMIGFSDPKTFFVGYSPSFLYQLPGLTWSMEEEPAFNTLDIKTAGGRTVLNPLYQNPLHSWKLKFNFLENDLNYDLPSATSTQLQNLYSFFCAQTGKYGEFLYKTREASVTGGKLGLPDSNGFVEMVFGLGPFFAESVQELNGAIPTIKVGATDITSTCTFYAASSVSPYTGIVFTSTFLNNPSLYSGQAITANFTWFYRVHFMDDKYTFEEFMYRLMKTGITLEQVRI